MGMAPTPEQLQRMRQINEGNGEGPSGPKPMVEGDIPPLSPLKKSEVSQIIHGVAWMHQKRILDHVMILCNNERTWDMVRKVLMGIMTEQVEMTQAVVGQKIRELQVKAKENIDDDGRIGSTSGTVASGAV